jgi:hypothetical protein
LATYDPVLDAHRNLVVDELREDVLVHLQLHHLAGRYFAYRHFWFVFVPLVSLAVLAMVVSFAYATPAPPDPGEMGSKDKRSLALASGFLSTLCVGLHIANNGFRVPRLPSSSLPGLSSVSSFFFFPPFSCAAAAAHLPLALILVRGSTRRGRRRTSRRRTTCRT